MLDPEDDTDDTGTEEPRYTEEELEAALVEARDRAFTKGRERGFQDGRVDMLTSVSSLNGSTEAVLSFLQKAFNPNQPRDHGKFSATGGANDGGEKRPAGTQGDTSETEGVANPDAHAQTLAARIAEVPAHVATKVKGWLHAKYAKLSARYGERGAKAILGAMVLLAPAPIPGSSLIPIALAEAVLAIRRAVKGVEKAMPNLDDAHIQALARDMLHELWEEMGEPLEPTEAEDAGVTGGDRGVHDGDGSRGSPDESVGNHLEQQPVQGREGRVAPPELELLDAAAEYAQACHADGTDPDDGLHRLYDLEPDELEAIASGGTIEKAWDSNLHPRDDAGKFVSKDKLQAAKSDPKLAAELKERVTKPDERKKLDAILSGEKDPGRTQRGEAKEQTRQKREKVQASRAEAKRLADKLQLLQGDATAEDYRALIPHLSTLTHDELSYLRTMLSTQGASFGGERRLEERRKRLLDWARGQAEGAEALSTDSLPLDVDTHPSQTDNVDDALELDPNGPSEKITATKPFDLPTPEIARPPLPAEHPLAPRLRDAIRDVAGGKEGVRVRLSDLRKRLHGIPADELTAAIRNLARRDELTLYPLDDPRQIQDADRAAAIESGTGVPQHILYYGGISSRHAPQPAATDMTPPTPAGDTAPPAKEGASVNATQPETSSPVIEARAASDAWTAWQAKNKPTYDKYNNATKAQQKRMDAKLAKLDAEAKPLKDAHDAAMAKLAAHNGHQYGVYHVESPGAEPKLIHTANTLADANERAERHATGANRGATNKSGRDITDEFGQKAGTWEHALTNGGKVYVGKVPHGGTQPNPAQESATPPKNAGELPFQVQRAVGQWDDPNASAKDKFNILGNIDTQYLDPLINGGHMTTSHEPGKVQMPVHNNEFFRKLNTRMLDWEKADKRSPQARKTIEDAISTFERHAQDIAHGLRHAAQNGVTVQDESGRPVDLEQAAAMYDTYAPQAAALARKEVAGTKSSPPSADASDKSPYLTAAQAAQRIGISENDFKERLNRHQDYKNLGRIRNGSDVLFRTADVMKLMGSSTS